jgi:Kdo2-lipid IVA lauroyltransferase/acyltransferase
MNLSRAFLEGLGAAHLTDHDVAARVIVENGHLLDEAMAGGKGLLVATAHFGSWELLGEVMARRGFPINAVVRPLRGALNARLVASRTRNGLRLIPPRGALRQSLAALSRNEVVVMLVDQVLPAAQGVFVPFFGRLACTNPAFSWAALRSGAPALVVMGAREGDRLRMTVEGPFPLPAGPRDLAITTHTAQITAVLEGHIRRLPEQWLWLHRRWKVQPPAAAVRSHAEAETHA